MMLVIFLLPSGSRRSARVMPGSVARRPLLVRDEQPEPSEWLLHSADTLSPGRSSDPMIQREPRQLRATLGGQLQYNVSH